MKMNAERLADETLHYVKNKTFDEGVAEKLKNEIKEYAKQKCEEQREIIANKYAEFGGGKDAKLHWIRKADEPKLD